MATLCVPAEPPVEDIREDPTTQQCSPPEPIAYAFRKVPKELHPQWTPSDPIFTREEVAKVPPLSELPRVLLPRDEVVFPPYLHYGLPITLDQINYFAQSHDPSIPIHTELGHVQAKRLVEDYLTEIIELPVYLECVLNAPDTPYIVCMVDNYGIESCMESNEMPKAEHIRRLQKALGVGVKVLPLWYVAGGPYQWEYL